MKELIERLASGTVADTVDDAIDEWIRGSLMEIGKGLRGARMVHEMGHNSIRMEVRPHGSADPRPIEVLLTGKYEKGGVTYTLRAFSPKGKGHTMRIKSNQSPDRVPQWIEDVLLDNYVEMKK
jgi:hypothetical protein